MDIRRHPDNGADERHPSDSVHVQIEFHEDSFLLAWFVTHPVFQQGVVFLTAGPDSMKNLPGAGGLYLGRGGLFHAVRKGWFIKKQYSYTLSVDEQLHLVIHASGYWMRGTPLTGWAALQMVRQLNRWLSLFIIKFNRLWLWAQTPVCAF